MSLTFGDTASNTWKHIKVWYGLVLLAGTAIFVLTGSQLEGSASRDHGSAAPQRRVAEPVYSAPVASQPPELVVYVVGSAEQAEQVRYWRWFEDMLFFAREIAQRRYEFSVVIAGPEAPDIASFEASLAGVSDVGGGAYQLVDLGQR